MVTNLSRGSHSPPRRAQHGVGLIEVLCIVAIIGILATIALPAYNMYALRSKFSEVVAATVPTKTAIATCVGTDACTVTNGVISVTGTAGGAISLPVMTTVTGSNGTSTIQAMPATEAQMWALIVAYFVYGSKYPDIALSAGTSSANGNAASFASVGWVIAQDPSNLSMYCAQVYYPATQTKAAYTSGCLSGEAPLATILGYYNSTVNPYWSSADDAIASSGLQAFPCVGSSSCTPPTKYVSSVVYSANGTITATASTFSGLGSETFILIPVYSSGALDWQVSGSCKTRGGGAIC